ncbi:MAG TPA: MFS transporter [Ignavibacteriaceae bacterium]|nr:MFS transporter [Ignavibacteriaceae bacterium]
MDNKLLNEYEKPTKLHFKILFMSWAGWVFDFYDLILFSFLLMPIGKELHLSDIQLSYVLGSSLAATALGGVLFGILSDRFGRKNVLQWTILTYSIGTFLCGISSSIAILLLFRIITGLGVGGEWATGQTYISETFPAKQRGRYGAFMQTGAPFGIVLASIVGGFLENIIGWRGCFFISILPALFITYIRKELPESDVWLARKNSRADYSPSSQIEFKKESNSFFILFTNKYRKLFIKCLILAIFDMSAYWFTYTWLPAYLHHERQFTLSKSAVWMLITQAGGLLGYFTFGFFADRFGRRPAYSVYSVIMALGLIMITLMWNYVANFPPLILSFMFLVGVGTGMFSGYGPLFAELFPTEIRNTAMGSAFNLARGIQFFTPVIIATIALQYGLSGGISLAALFALLTGAWIWVFPETKGKVISA